MSLPSSLVRGWGSNQQAVHRFIHRLWTNEGDHPTGWSPLRFTALLSQAQLQRVQLGAQQRRQLLADLLEPLLDERHLRTPLARVELERRLDVLLRRVK